MRFNTREVSFFVVVVFFFFFVFCFGFFFFFWFFLSDDEMVCIVYLHLFEKIVFMSYGAVLLIVIYPQIRFALCF